MPHTNNPNAAKRKVNRHDPRKPKFLQKKGKPKATVGGTTEVPRAELTALISEFHTIEKQLAHTTDEKERQRLLGRQEELGGLEAYQKASLHGGDKSRGGESGKWCVKMLKELKVGVEDKGKAKAVEPEIVKGPDGKERKVWPKVIREKLRLLDVGAITGTSFASYPWIEATCIDLNPQSEEVLKYDFFDYPVPPKDQLFDVVALSLVINFIGSLTKRGEILRHAHKFLKPKGLLYIVLPLPCLTNSRYLTHERFTDILATTGWKSTRRHDSAKLTYWLLERVGDGAGDTKSWKKEEIRKGISRNNFCVIVEGSGAAAVEKEQEPTDAEVTKEEEEEEEEEAEAEAEAEEWGGISADEKEGGAADEEEEEWKGID